MGTHGKSLCGSYKNHGEGQEREVVLQEIPPGNVDRIVLSGLSFAGMMRFCCRSGRPAWLQILRLACVAPRMFQAAHFDLPTFAYSLLGEERMRHRRNTKI